MQWSWGKKLKTWKFISDNSSKPWWHKRIGEVFNMIIIIYLFFLWQDGGSLDQVMKSAPKGRIPENILGKVTVAVSLNFLHLK